MTSSVSVQGLSASGGKLVTGDLDSSLANLASNLNFGPASNRSDSRTVFGLTTTSMVTFLFMLNVDNFQTFSFKRIQRPTYGNSVSRFWSLPTAATGYGESDMIHQIRNL